MAFNVKNTIGIPVKDVGERIVKLNKILEENNMALKAENDISVCFWKDKETAVSLKLEVVLLADTKEENKEEKTDEK